MKLQCDPCVFLMYKNSAWTVKQKFGSVFFVRKTGLATKMRTIKSEKVFL